MSNDETPDQPEEGSMIFMQLPAEVREYFIHQRMHAEENGHTALSFLESLNEEQLRTFRSILSGTSAMPDSVPYYMGLVGMLLLRKFNICIACGKNHDEALADIAGEGPRFNLEQYVIDLNNYEVELPDDVSYLDKNFDAEDTPVYCTGPCSKRPGTRGRWANLNARMESKAGHGGCDFCASIVKWG